MPLSKYNTLLTSSYHIYFNGPHIAVVQLHAECPDIHQPKGRRRQLHLAGRMQEAYCEPLELQVAVGNLERLFGLQRVGLRLEVDEFLELLDHTAIRARRHCMANSSAAKL